MVLSRPRFSLQSVVLVPVVIVMAVAGAVLFLLVLRTVSNYADRNIRADLDALARNAFAIADSEVDRQNRDGRAGDTRASKLYQLSARIRFEDFSREYEVGLLVEAEGQMDFQTGGPVSELDTLRRFAPDIGIARAELPSGAAYYLRTINFAPWNWRLVLVKDAAAFESVVGQVRAIYLGSAGALVILTALLVLLLHYVLVRPIYRIAGEFAEGRAPDYQGIKELDYLSSRIAEMMRSIKAKTLHLETTLESMSDGIAVFDADMRLAAWNKRFVDHYRYPGRLVREGTSFADIMRYNVERGDYGPGDADSRLAVIVERARTLDPPRFEVDRADGTSTEVRRGRMPDGGFVSTYTDITDRKQAARLEAENKAKSEFLQNMTHDLRSPANSIIADTQALLEQRDDAKPDETVRKTIELIRADARHLRDMINELMEMSQLEAGIVLPRVAEVEIDALVENALRAIEPIARKKGLKTSACVDDDLCIATDGGMLRRVLQNLAENAARYTERGSVSIIARSRGDVVSIEVADTGKGIPVDKLNLIFEKFQQVESTAGFVKPGMGLGLGLSISRGLVALLGGEIGVESKVGAGSKFTISLPAAGSAIP